MNNWDKHEASTWLSNGAASAQNNIGANYCSSDSYIVNAANSWPSWNNTYNTAIVTTCGNYTNGWSAWNTGYSSQIDIERVFQRQLQAQEQARFQEHLDAGMKAREAAQARATKLLVANLNAEQAKDFATHRRFTVHTANGERTYLIEYGIAGNIKLLNAAGVAVTKLCIHPNARCPTEDVMLAQKLMIETDEPTFWKVANKTNIAA